MRRLVLLAVVSAAVVAGIVGVCAVAVVVSTQRGGARQQGLIAYWSPTEKVVKTVRPEHVGTSQRVANGAVPALSPDGRKIAYVDDSNFVVVANPDGSSPSRIICGRGIADAIDWSPDGHKLICGTSWETAPEVSGSDLTIVDLGTGVSRTIVPSASHPSWSPDGRRIAYERGAAISVFDLSTHRVLRLRTGSAPSWSPDGTQLVYVTGYALRVMRSDGSMPRVVLRSAQQAYFGHPTWSPDGSRIAFVAPDTHGGSEIRAVNVDGSGERILVRDAADPDWTRGG